MTTKEFFTGLKACTYGIKWAEGKENLREVWEKCERSDWMIWALRKIDFKDDRKYRLYACACVRGTPLADGRTLWDLLTDDRSRNAVEVAERYAEGKASEEERLEARKAADAHARKWQADLLRQWISWDEVEAAIAVYQGKA
jgi:hypothetical protein